MTEEFDPFYVEIVYEKIQVYPNEKTCTNCGETTYTDYCFRCSANGAGKEQLLIPTLHYLFPDEYEMVT